MNNRNDISVPARKAILIKTVLLVVLPVVSCMCFALFQGKNIWNLYLPNSEFNDELLYFKQIESVITYGLPKGYFGYNESHAQLLTFSTWSPVIIYPIAAIARLFSFNFFTPYIINSFLLSLSLAIFSLVYKPKWIEIVSLYGIMILFIPISRLQLSMMSDVEILALCIAYSSLYIRAEALNELKEDVSNGIIVGLFAFSCILSIMRPYFLLLLIVPSIYLAKKNRKSILLSILIFIITMFTYVIISKLFTATYFVQTIQTEWIKDIIASPISGTRKAISIFAYGCRTVLGYFTNGFKSGAMIDSLWILYVLLLVYTVISSFFDRKKWMWSVFLILFAGAVMMFYDINVGCRHLLPYIVIMLFIHLSDAKYGRFFSGAIVIIIIILFTARINADKYNYVLPVKNNELASAIETISTQTAGILNEDENASEWDNTVIWVWRDEDRTIVWNELYGLPAGIGINMCTSDYVESNWGNLKSAYIASTPDGFVAKMCETEGSVLVAETDNICIWKIAK